MPNKSALLIGINVYPFLKDSAQLKGCQNDVFALQTVLEQKFEFPTENIRTLLDEQATRSEIINAMKFLVDNCGENDSIVFFFSGHGSRIRTRKENKPSGWYETIMPFDSGRKPLGTNIDITDDEIYEWLTALSEQTSNIVLIFDSCYAGSILRNDEFEPGTRGIQPDEETFLNEAPPPLFFHSPQVDMDQKNQKKSLSGWLPLSDKYVLFAACAEHERAHMLKEPENGALTFFLCQALEEAKSGDNYRDIWDQVFLNIKDRFEKQHAQLEGNRDRELFGLKEFPSFLFLLITNQQKNRLTLSGGLLHGVTLNSEWIVYPPGTKHHNPAAVLGKIKVVSVQTHMAQAVLVEATGPKKFEIGSRTVEVSRRMAKSRLKVWVEKTPSAGEETLNRLKQDLSKSHLLTVIARKELADVRIYLKNQVNITSDSPTGRLPEPLLTVYGQDNILLMPPQTNPQIIENLERFSRYRRLIELRNPGSIMAGKIDFTILKQNNDSSWSEIEPTGVEEKIVIHESDRIAVKIVNRFEAPIFFSILDLGLTKRIKLLFPPPGRKAIIGPLGNKTQGKGVLTLGIAENESFQLSFPTEFPFTETFPGNNSVRDEGLEVFKLIVTTRPHDLSFLEQGHLRTAKTAENSVEDLLISTWRGDENFDKDPLHESEDEWFSINKIFFLKRN